MFDNFVEGIGGRTSLLAGTPNRLIIIIQHDTHLIHQLHLLLIIPLKLIALARSRRRSSRENRASERSVHVGENRRHVLCGDPRHGLGSTHFSILLTRLTRINSVTESGVRVRLGEMERATSQ